MSTRDRSILATLAGANGEVVVEPSAVGRAVPVAAIDDPEAMDHAASVWITLLVIVAIVLRLLLFVLGPATEMDHAVTPETLAHLSAAGLPGTDAAIARPAVLAAAEHLQLTRTTGGGDVLVGPAYPALMSTVAQMSLPRHALVLVQCLAGAGGVLLAWVVGRHLFGRADAALVPAVVAAVHPALLIHSIALSPAVLALAAVLGGLAVILAWPGVRSAVIGGALLGGAALVLPVVAWIPAVVALWLPIHRRKWSAVASAALLLLAAAAPTGLWVMRNVENGTGLRLSAEPVVAVALDLVPRATATPPDLTATLPDGDLDARLGAVGAQAIATLRGTPRSATEQVARRAQQLLIDGDITPLYSLLALAIEPVDPMGAIRTGDWSMRQQADPAGARLAMGLMIVDALLLAAAMIGFALVLWRRHFTAALLPIALTFGCLVAASLTLWPANMRSLVVLWLALLAGAAIVPAKPRAPRPPREKKKRSIKAKFATTFDKSLEELPEEPAPRMGRPI